MHQVSCTQRPLAWHSWEAEEEGDGEADFLLSRMETPRNLGCGEELTK